MAKTAEGTDFDPSRRRFMKKGGLLAAGLLLRGEAFNFLGEKKMENIQTYDVIIIGGSYAGLAAAMALGRSLRKVLVIDSGKPCNAQTPFSHNFITHDGRKPAEIAALAREQVSRYKNVAFVNDLATSGSQLEEGFLIKTARGQKFRAGRLIFATGVKEKFPAISGIEACWGISVLHCPYCHGYEVRHEKTGIMASGEAAYEMAVLVSNWTKDLTVFTNGASGLSAEQQQKLAAHNIAVIEKKIEGLEHREGRLEKLRFKDQSTIALKALYVRNAFEQHCAIAADLGCELTPEGYIAVDATQRSTVNGIYACGDNVTRLRTVANAVAMGTTAGMMLNREMVFEEF